MKKHFSKALRIAIACMVVTFLVMSAVTVLASNATIGTISNAAADANGYLVTVPVTNAAAQTTILVYQDTTGTVGVIDQGDIKYADQATVTGGTTEFKFYLPATGTYNIKVGGTGLAVADTTYLVTAGHTHTYDAGVVTTPATCGAAGVKTFTCTTCPEGTEGHSYTETIPATGLHTWGDWTVATSATCVATGTQTHECSVCHQTENGVIPVDTIGGHNYTSAVTTPATCGDPGVKTYTCTLCTEGTSGHSYTEAIPATGLHTWGDWEVTTPATCAATGIKTRTCSVCGDEETDVVAINPTAHNYTSAVTTEATCGDPGVKTYTCTLCTEGTEGHSYTEAIPATGLHTWGEWEVTTPATCAATGIKTRTCSVCGDEETDVVAINPTAHNYTSAVTTEATCGDPGVKTYTCTLCTEGTEGHSYTEAIPATGLHTWGAWVADDETTHTRTCTECLEKETENHAFGDDNVCDVCEYALDVRHTATGVKSLATISIAAVNADPIYLASKLPENAEVNYTGGTANVKINWSDVTEVLATGTVTGTLDETAFKAIFKDEDYEGCKNVSVNYNVVSEVFAVSVNDITNAIVYVDAAGNINVKVDAEVAEKGVYKYAAVVRRHNSGAAVVPSYADAEKATATGAGESKEFTLGLAENSTIHIYVFDGSGNVSSVIKKNVYIGGTAVTMTVNDKADVWRHKKTDGLNVNVIATDKNSGNSKNDTTITYELLDYTTKAVVDTSLDGHFDITGRASGAYTVKATVKVGGNIVATVTKTAYIADNAVFATILSNDMSGAIRTYIGSTVSLAANLDSASVGLPGVAWAAKLSDYEGTASFVDDDFTAFAGSKVVNAGDVAGTKKLNIMFKVNGLDDFQTARTVYVKESEYTMYIMYSKTSTANIKIDSETNTFTLCPEIYNTSVLAPLTALPEGYALSYEITNYKGTEVVTTGTISSEEIAAGKTISMEGFTGQSYRVKLILKDASEQTVKTAYRYLFR